jgi:hypothetical protein
MRDGDTGLERRSVVRLWVNSRRLEGARRAE